MAIQEPTQPTVLTRGVDLTLSPEEVFANLHRMSGFFFLDSALADHSLASYSYMGMAPYRTLRSRGDGMDLVDGKKIRHLRGNPLTVLESLLREHQVSSAGLMIPFAGGGVGYFSYELGAITTERDMDREDDLGLPEMHVAFYDTILAYDHKAKRWLGAAVDLTGSKSAAVRKRLGNRVDKLAELAAKPHRGPQGPFISTDAGDDDAAEATPEAGHTVTVDDLEVTTTMSRDEYLASVRSIQEKIAAGDIYQANLTQRWTVPFEGDPGDLYHALRTASPAPFGIYLNTGECVIAGSSPESFLSIHGRKVETRPIKGTRPRGATPDEDRALRAELGESAKDKAELTMIADLARNDLGRVCKAGSIEVEELYRPETFSNVHHLVSVVKGELEPGVGFRDVMTAAFPGGSITGAPKLRAMKILDGLEKKVRGPYTGAMGYLGLDGSVELNIAIRTLVLTQGRCHLGVGSGIVADSVPEDEYDECVAKAKDMVAALRSTLASKKEEAPAEAAGSEEPGSTPVSS